ncbi:uncharacterized protein [Rutidosis leptorrhynchoides]|uniref:uncharacterized protein n=1 Tax=Rutidosis leptorrhynchoides TaxID=125765 RepID=UPI003A9A65EE
MEIGRNIIFNQFVRLGFSVLLDSHPISNLVSVSDCIIFYVYYLAFHGRFLMLFVNYFRQVMYQDDRSVSFDPLAQPAHETTFVAATSGIDLLGTSERVEIIGSQRTDEEHMIGSNRLSRDCLGITRHYLTTRIPSQVAIHAQKAKRYL